MHSVHSCCLAPYALLHSIIKLHFTCFITLIHTLLASEIDKCRIFLLMIISFLPKLHCFSWIDSKWAVWREREKKKNELKIVVVAFWKYWHQHSSTILRMEKTTRKSMIRFLLLRSEVSYHVVCSFLLLFCILLW